MTDYELFRVDPAASHIDATGTLRLVSGEAELVLDLVAQGSVGIGQPGYSDGLSFLLDGYFLANVDVSGQSIDFPAIGSIHAQPSGDWRPPFGSDFGVAPAPIGVSVDVAQYVPLLAGTVEVALRDIGGVLRSAGSLALAGDANAATFDSSQLEFVISSGMFSHASSGAVGMLLGSYSGPFFNGDDSIRGTNMAGPATWTGPLGDSRLHIPFDVTVSEHFGILESVFDSAVFEFRLAGELVGQSGTLPPGVFFDGPDNNSFATAQNIDGLFVRTANPHVGGAFRHPFENRSVRFTGSDVDHVTFILEGNGDFEFFSLTIDEPGTTGYFDVDGGQNLSRILLFNDQLQLLEWSNVYGQTDGNGGSLFPFLDAFLAYEFADPGLYYVVLAGDNGLFWNGQFVGNGLASGDVIEMHFSLMPAIAVPEPTTLTLLAFGGAILGLCHLRSRRRRAVDQGVPACPDNE